MQYARRTPVFRNIIINLKYIVKINININSFIYSIGNLNESPIFHLH